MLPLAMIILARNAQILACDDLSLLRSLPHETKLVHSDPHHVFVVGAHSDFEVPRSDLREAEILPSPGLEHLRVLWMKSPDAAESPGRRLIAHKKLELLWIAPGLYDQDAKGIEGLGALALKAKHGGLADPYLLVAVQFSVDRCGPVIAGCQQKLTAVFFGQEVAG